MSSVASVLPQQYSSALNLGGTIGMIVAIIVRSLLGLLYLSYELPLNMMVDK